MAERLTRLVDLDQPGTIREALLPERLDYVTDELCPFVLVYR